MEEADDVQVVQLSFARLRRARKGYGRPARLEADRHAVSIHIRYVGIPGHPKGEETMRNDSNDTETQVKEEIQKLIDGEEEELGRDPQKITHAEFWTHFTQLISVRM